MISQRSLFVLVIVLAVLGLGFIGSGITGLVVFDQNVQEICSSDNECRASEKCCLFYQESAGVCNSPELCKGIAELTRNQKESRSALVSFARTQEKSLMNAFMVEAVFGGIIIVIALYVLSHYNRLNPLKQTQEVSMAKRKRKHIAK